MITKHGSERVKQRQNISPKSQKRLINTVLKNGVTHAETTGQLNKYITKLYFVNEANNIKLYGDYVYIFKDGAFITSFLIPNKLLKQAHKAERRKKYCTALEND